MKRYTSVVTPNDPGDGDAGGNNLQNFPDLISATSGGGSTTLTGTLNSTPNTQLLLEFFSNTSCNPSGHGEGQRFIGVKLVTTDAGGNLMFTITFPGAVPGGMGITATATDPAGNTSEFSNCVGVLGAPNQPPDAVNDTASTAEDTPVNISVLSNDTDPDGGTLTVTAVTQGSNGSVVNNGNGTVTYSPNMNFNGMDTFSYTISDGQSGSDTATVAVTVTAMNDPPNAVDDPATTDEDTPVTINVLSNDTDPDGNPLTVTSVTQGSHGSVQIVNAGTKVKYTPNPNFNGSDSFTYTISDGQGGMDTATVNVAVNSINDPPDAVNDAAITDENAAVTISVLANDTDPENDPLTINSFSQGSHGMVANLGGGSLRYTPNHNFSGTDMFSYTIGDGHGGMDTAMVAVLVNQVVILQDDRNAYCVNVNLGTNRYVAKIGGATFTGPVLITLTETTVTFRSGAGDVNFLSGGMDIFRKLGSARFQAPRSTGPVYIINDSYTEDDGACP